MTSQPTTTTQADYDAALVTALAELTQEQRDALAAKARAKPIRSLDRRARDYAIWLIRGCRPRDAARKAGMVLAGNWDIIMDARRDPYYNAVYRYAELCTAERMRAKAGDVLEQTLDGDDVTREQARAAIVYAQQELIARREADGRAEGAGKTPSVVINLSNNSALQSVAAGPGKVITANIIE